MTKPVIEDLINALPRHEGNASRWLAIRALSNITEIMVHWKGTPAPKDEVQSLKNDAAYHIAKDWNTGPAVAHGWAIMYHFAVGRSGRIFQLNPLTHITWHGNDGNRRALGIQCILGLGQVPTKEQLTSLEALVRWLTEDRPDIPAGRRNVWGHGECGGQYGGGPAFNTNTSCPGPDLLKWVRAYRAAQPAPPVPEPAPTPVPEPPGQQPTLPVFYPQTGHSVGGRIGEAYLERGGPDWLGYPITQEYGKPLEDGHWWTVQLFERGMLHWRIESHPNVYVARIGLDIKALDEAKGYLVAEE